MPGEDRPLQAATREYRISVLSVMRILYRAGKMSRGIFCALALLTGCGFLPAKPDFVTKQGVRVFTDGCALGKEKLDMLLDIFAEQMPRLVEGVTPFQIYEMYPWTSVFFQEDPINFGSGHAYGTYSARTIFVWCNSTNICMTSFLHEYTHMVQDIKYGLTARFTSAELHEYPEFVALDKLNAILEMSDVCIN